VIVHRLAVVVSIVGVFAWVFADALFGSGVFVFRDSGHYYYPLFQFVKGEWLAGRVPLWNPYENIGVPLAGNATSSVFYPGTLVLFLPVDYATAYAWYVMGHVLLAAWTAYRLARYWGASVEAAGVAALSYAYSGNVLFQYCNVIYLVGAAWLPLAVLAADRMLTRGSGAGVQGSGRDRGSNRPIGRVRGAVGLGAMLALMTLGGNAELAYHAGLLAAMYSVWLWWYQRRRADSGGRLATSRPLLLAVAAVAGLALSAVQVLPSIEFTRLSGRAVSSVPRTIYGVPGHLLAPQKGTVPFSLRENRDSPPTGHWTDGLTCRRLEPGTHHAHVYHFSVGPWRLPEYVWPNVSGRQFPVHRRWLEVVPAEGRIWVPSLYMGVVPLVLALGAMRFRQADPRIVWLSWTVVLAVLASFGWYGLGWLAAESRAAAGADVSKSWLVGRPFGGLYWLMSVLLPGYIYFRYPAKLLVIAALGLSMLAAVGWDGAFAGPARRLRQGLVWLGGISLVGAAVALAVRPFWHGWLAGVAADMMFGPLDTAGAHNDLLAGFLQTAAVSGLFLWLLRRAAGGARWPVAGALLLVAVDLGAANRWMVACDPATQWERTPKLEAAMRDKMGEDDSASRSSLQDCEPYRVYRERVWTPPSWRLESSPSRLADAAKWDRDTLWPKYHLAPRIPLAEVPGTMTPYDYQVFVAQRGPPPFATKKTPDPLNVPAALSNVRFFILRGDERLTGAVCLGTGQDTLGVENVSLWQVSEHLPRAWIVHQIDVLGPVESCDPTAIRRRTDRVFFTGAGPRNPRRSALVELDGESRKLDLSAAEAKTPGAETAPSSGGEESCLISRYDPLRVEIRARLSRPGLVVLFDQFYPGWRLDVETAGRRSRRVPILRTNRVMRGAWLPAGDHRLIYRFRPASFKIGAAVSAFAWMALGVIALTSRLSGGRPRGKRRPFELWHRK